MSQALNIWPLRQSYIVALGANLPSRLGMPNETLHCVTQSLHEYNCKSLKVSRFFSCPAFPAGNGPDYVNSVAEIEGPGDPAEMLSVLHRIEADIGRTRDVRWGQRVLDLDLIAAGNVILPDTKTHQNWRDLPLHDQIESTPDELVLPHPRLQDRAFVLVPLAEIAPDWVHPALGFTVREMCDALPAMAKAEMKPL